MATKPRSEPTYCKCGRKWPDEKRGICGVCIAEASMLKAMRPKRERMPAGRNAVTVRLPSPATSDEKYHGRLMAS